METLYWKTLDPTDHEHMLHYDGKRERNNFYKWQIMCFGLGRREEHANRQVRVKEEDIIFTRVTSTPAEEKLRKTQFWGALPTDEAAGRYTAGKQALRSTFPEGYPIPSLAKQKSFLCGITLENLWSVLPVFKMQDSKTVINPGGGIRR